MPPTPSYSKVVSNTVAPGLGVAAIPPSRFVSLDPLGGADRVMLCGAAGKVYGVSQPGVRNPPWNSSSGTGAGWDDGQHAVAGETIAVFGPPAKGVLLELGGTVAAGDTLKSDTLGRGVTTATTGDWAGGVAQEPGTLGDLIRVQLLQPSQF
jgi:hypothetical protein